MDWTTNVAVHESARPEAMRGRIVEALRRGETDPALLYSGLRQTTLWTALHRSVSPAVSDRSISALYDNAFAEAARQVKGNVAHVVSLACGDGGKDVRCLRALRALDRAVLYSPADISFEMALSAERTAGGAVKGLQCNPVVCDLLHCTVLPGILKSFDPSGAERVVLFLGAIQNHPAAGALRAILNAVRSQDQLIVGANLAPAENYDEALARILPQYDNEPTRAWLWGALGELSLTSADGELRIAIAEARLGEAKSFEARFVFSRGREIAILGERVSFEAGASLRVFYSQRFTAAQARGLLTNAGLVVTDEWIAPEEGLFLCRRPAAGQ